MTLNWTLDVVMGGIIGTIIMIGSIISYTTYRRKRVKPLLFFSISYFFVSLYFFFDFLSILYMNIELARIHYVIFFPATIFLVIAIDYTIAESINALKMCIACSLGSIITILAYLPDSIRVDTSKGYEDFAMDFLFSVFTLVLLMYFMFLHVIWGIKMRRNAPNQLKKESNLVLLGIIIMGPLDLIIFLFSTMIPILIIVDYIVLCTGAMIILHVLITEPKIHYILPFKAYWLQVISTLAGFSLFDYEWTESDKDSNLVAGLLSAVEKMSIEVLGKGIIQEFNLEEGILLFKRGEFVTAGLLTSRSSKFLRDSLQNFVDDFEKSFNKALRNRSSVISKFDSADDLITRNFTYVPKRL